MITDLIDVETVLGQHDPGMIVVGPLQSLSINSGYRYFYIAGNGKKVYETISLGFVEVAANAQKQRADFIKKLKGRFAEVFTFDSHLEMAQAVHSRWPNGETAKFLGFAELGAKPKPTKVAGQQESIDDDGSDAGVVPGDNGKQLVDKVAPEPVDHAKDNDAVSRYAPPLPREQAQPIPVSRPAQKPVPSSLPIATINQPLRRDRAVTEQQRHSGLSQDDIASAILRLKPPAELGSVPRLPVEGARSLASIMLRFGAVGCAVALVVALVAWVLVRPSPWQVADEAAPAPVPAPSISVSRNKDPSQAPAAAPPSVPNQPTAANKPALQAKPVPAMVPPSPPSQPSRSVNRDTDSLKRGDLDPSQAAPPVPSSVPNQPTAANKPALQAEPAPATVPPSPPPSQPSPSVNRDTDSLKRGDLDPSQAAAARPSSVPNQHTEANKPALQAEPAPASVPPSPPLQPSPSVDRGTDSRSAAISTPRKPPLHGHRRSRTSPRRPTSRRCRPSPRPLRCHLLRHRSHHKWQAAPVSGPQSLPAQGGSTARRLDAEEIATLVSRGTDFMKSGDLASARLLLRRAAEAGSASAALMLGTTFDPLVIQQLGAFGVVPDVAQARQWYEKAAALGSDAAAQRLAKLPRTGQ